jgi:adenine-specific DNA-methyltransferase
VVIGAKGMSTYGEVFTRPWVVDAILDLVGYTPDVDLAGRTIIEPSCGSGAFLVPVVERLVKAAEQSDTPLASLTGCVRAYDLQPDNVDLARKQAGEVLLTAGCPRNVAESLATTWVRQADFLLDDENITADYAVGNPPYVRLEALPKELLATYRATWPSMRGRADIYVGFVERMLQLLKPGGRVGVICADRWMRNEYGEALRKIIASDYAVEHVWTMHHVDAFESEVAAYPAITVLRRGSQGAVAVADTARTFGAAQARRLVSWARGRRGDVDGRGFRGFRSPTWPTGGSPWPIGSVERLRVLSHLQQDCPPLEDPATGTEVSIGVATGADRIYISDNPRLVEPDRLLPLVMTEDVAGGEFHWTGQYLVNPWNMGRTRAAPVRIPR